MADGAGLLDRSALCAVVDLAKRAPSPLNTQPARWRLSAAHANELELVEDPARRLFASDPSGRDHRLALGAAWEATRLALGARGLRLADEVGAHVSDAGLMARARIVSGGTRDPLVDAIDNRASWRRQFLRGAVDAAALDALGRALAAEGALLVADRAIIDEAAALIDPASVRALLRPRYLEEQLDWMRAPAHKNHDRDGISAAALGLSSWAAGTLARPAWFARLARWGLAERVVSERKQTRSASALVAITAPADEPDLVTGARFYRAWLRVAAAGLHACPMSVLTDDDALNARFRVAIGVAAERKLVHLWRVGVADGVVPRAPRLPTEELVL